jgi:hypothetical protein
MIRKGAYSIKDLESDLTNDPSIYDSRQSQDIEELKSELFSTSSGNTTQQNYQTKLPDRLNIIRSLNLSVLDNCESTLKNTVIDFVQSFQYLIIYNINNLNASGQLPSLILNILEDGSALLEWGFKDFKIGFSFESKIDESSWYLVANEKFQDASVNGKLDFGKLDLFLSKILFFVANNT